MTKPLSLEKKLKTAIHSKSNAPLLKIIKKYSKEQMKNTWIDEPCYTHFDDIFSYCLRFSPQKAKILYDFGVVDGKFLTTVSTLGYCSIFEYVIKNELIGLFYIFAKEKFDFNEIWVDDNEFILPLDYAIRHNLSKSIEALPIYGAKTFQEIKSNYVELSIKLKNRKLNQSFLRRIYNKLVEILMSI